MNQWKKFERQLLFQNSTCKVFLEEMIKFFNWIELSYYIGYETDVGYHGVAWTKTTDKLYTIGSSIICNSESEALNKAILDLIQKIYQNFGIDSKQVISVLERNSYNKKYNFRNKRISLS